MNVTLGVPRIKEIINASDKISSSIFTIPLAFNKNSFRFARLICGKLEATTLQNVAKYIKLRYTTSAITIVIRLDESYIFKNYLDVDARVVRDVLVNSGSICKIKLKESK